MKLVKVELSFTKEEWELISAAADNTGQLAGDWCEAMVRDAASDPYWRVGVSDRINELAEKIRTGEGGAT